MYYSSVCRNALDRAGESRPEKPRGHRVLFLYTQTHILFVATKIVTTAAMTIPKFVAGHRRCNGRGLGIKG